MPSMASLGIVAACCLVLFANASNTQVTQTSSDVAQVISLMDKLQADMKVAIQTAAQEYDRYACFAKEEVLKYAQAIQSANDVIDSLSATMAEKTTAKEGVIRNLQERKAKQEEYYKSMQEAHSASMKDRTQYEYSASDLTKAISSLNGAITGIESRMKGTSSFLSLDKDLRVSIARSLAMADAMGLLHADGKKQKVLGTLLNQESQEPSEHDYKFHSQELLEVLREVLQSFNSQKTTLDSEWTRTSSSYQDTIANLQSQITSNDETMKDLRVKEGSLSSEIASARQNIVNEKSSLESDKQMLQDTNAEAEARAADFDASQKMRHEEVDTIATVMEMVKGKVRDADQHISSGNKLGLLSEAGKEYVSLSVQNVHYQKLVAHRSLLLGFERQVQKAEAKAASIATGMQITPDQVHVDVSAGSEEDEVQTESSISFPHSADAAAVQRAMNSSEAKIALITDTVKSVQNVMGIRSVSDGAVYASNPIVSAARSRRLSFLALDHDNAEASKQVRVQDLLREEGQRLQSPALISLAIQAAADPNKKVTNLIFQLITRLQEEANQQLSQKAFCDEELKKAKDDFAYRQQAIDELVSLINSLTASKDQLALEIKELLELIRSGQMSLIELRKLRQEEKAANILTIDKANQAIQTLESASSILSTMYRNGRKQSYNKGSYKGNQDAESNLTGMLSTLKSDFEKTVRDTTDEEKVRAKAFTLLERVSRGNIGAKTTQETMDEEDLAKTITEISQDDNDMKAQMAIKDSDTQKLASLKQMCFDPNETFEQRAAKRNQEIRTLKKAQCIMNGEKHCDDVE